MRQTWVFHADAYKKKVKIKILSTTNIPAVGTLAARTQGRIALRAVAFLWFIMIPSLGSAAIYKCTAQDGSLTYTDIPCSADTTTQQVDPSAPAWLNESWLTMNTAAALRDAKFQSRAEIIAAFCANDEFRVWLKAQRQGLPERDTRAARFVEITKLCRKALHLPVVAAAVLQTP